MAESKLEKHVKTLYTEVIANLGYDLVDVDFIKENGERYLRFYIDKRGGISIDDCVLVSQTLDPLLDEQVDIQESYNLEVSSPGLDRPLQTEADFKRYMGELVEVSLYKAREGQKKWVGNIFSYDPETDILIIEVNEEKETFSKAERAKVKRYIQF